MMSVKFAVFLVLMTSCGYFVYGKQPHILIVIADDYGWNDIGYHGSEIKTPNLDQLAAEGIKLENYYVQPICTPTRSQLMSGRYQIHTGLQHGVIHPPIPNGLPLTDETMAKQLKNLGYSTHIVGKWHLGFYKKEFTPTYRGFDSFFGYYNGAEDYFTHIRCEGKFGCGHDLHEDADEKLREADNYRGLYSTQVFAKRVQELVTQHATESKDKPLFMYMPFQAVHAPLEVPKEYEKPYESIKDRQRRTYAGMVAALDEAVGNITYTYKQLGLWDDTVMVFSTDNGGQIHAGGNNWPLRGWKDSLWEGGVHGVGFVHGNMLMKKGTSNHELVHVSDWYPTLVNLAGGDTSNLELDGHDVWKTISEGAPSPRKELLHNIDPLYPPKGKKLNNSTFDNRVRAAIRVGDYKLVTGTPGNGSWIAPPQLTDSTLRFLPSQHIQMPSTHQTSLHPVGEDTQNIWLFNIKDDPNEKTDLSDQMPDKVKEMLDRLAYYNSTAVPCRYPEPDPKCSPKLHGGYWAPWED